MDLISSHTRSRSSSKSPSRKASKSPGRPRKVATPSKAGNLKTPAAETPSKAFAQLDIHSPDASIKPARNTPKRSAAVNYKEENGSPPKRAYGEFTPTKGLATDIKEEASSPIKRVLRKSAPNTPKRKLTFVSDADFKAKQEALTDSSPERSTSERKFLEIESDEMNGKENVQEDDECVFKDESGKLITNAAEHYFLQGKSVQMNAAKRKGKRGKRGIADDPLNEILTDDEKDCAEIESRFAVCNLSELRDYAEKADSMLPKSVVKATRLLEEKQFPRWKVYVEMKYNLLVHGVGSKIKLLDNFRNNYYKDHRNLTICGYREEATVRNILKLIEEKLKLKIAACDRRKCITYAKSIKKELEKESKDRNLYLFIHNIDGPNMRESEDQEALCVLSQSPKIRLIATIDHINATLLWDTRQMSQFNWIFVNADTFHVPIKEIMASQSKLLGLNPKSSLSAHSISSLDTLWQSLADKSKKIFALFFAMTLSSKQGVAFWDLFNDARNNFLVQTDAALRQQLVEFEDHRVLKRVRQADGNEQLKSCIDKDLITKFLEAKGFPLTVEKDDE